MLIFICISHNSYACARELANNDYYEYKKYTEDGKHIFIMSPNSKKARISGLYKLSADKTSIDPNPVYTVKWNGKIKYISRNGKVVIRSSDDVNIHGVGIYRNGKLTSLLNNTISPLTSSVRFTCGPPAVTSSVSIDEKKIITYKLHDYTDHRINRETGEIFDSSLFGIKINYVGRGYITIPIPFSKKKILFYEGRFLKIVNTINLLHTTIDKTDWLNYGHQYEKIDNQIYYQGMNIQSKSPTTFRTTKQLNGYVVTRDSYDLYEKGSPLPHSKSFPYESLTYKKISYHYAKDAINFYYENKIMSDVDKKTFKKIKYKYFKDKKSIYLYGKKIKGVDVTSFTIIDQTYSKDNKRVYRNGEPLSRSLRPNTFRVLLNEYGSNYTYDSKHVYYNDKKIKNADYKSFQIKKQYRYSSDKDRIYFSGREIKNASNETFVILKHDYSKDKNFIYYQSKKLKNSDMNSFIIYSYYLAKDSSNVYFLGQKIKKADAMSFRFKNGDFIHDSNYRYKVWQGKLLIEPYKEKKLK